jgi:hypothetical protein
MPAMGSERGIIRDMKITALLRGLKTYTSRPQARRTIGLRHDPYGIRGQIAIDDWESLPNRMLGKRLTHA